MLGREKSLGGRKGAVEGSSKQIKNTNMNRLFSLLLRHARYQRLFSLPLQDIQDMQGSLDVQWTMRQLEVPKDSNRNTQSCSDAMNKNTMRYNTIYLRLLIRPRVLVNTIVSETHTRKD